MKCPKCGFNSFEFYESCKKCSIDLTGYKQTYSIASMILPLEAKEKIAAEFQSAGNATERVSTTAETRDDIFSFDLPGGDSPSAPVLHNDDPFNFDEPSTDAKQTNRSKSENAFADLLESTSQTDESPFGSHADVSAAPEKAVEPSSESSEFDLESFSWDDNTSAAIDGKEVDDDFDSLFGDPKEKNIK